MIEGALEKPTALRRAELATRAAWFFSLFIVVAISPLMLMMAMTQNGFHTASLMQWVAFLTVTVGLSYGIYKKSRACAALMCLNIFAGTLIHTLSAGLSLSAVLSVISLGVYGYALWGTIRWHQLIFETG